MKIDVGRSKPWFRHSIVPTDSADPSRIYRLLAYMKKMRATDLEYKEGRRSSARVRRLSQCATAGCSRLTSPFNWYPNRTAEKRFNKIGPQKKRFTNSFYFIFFICSIWRNNRTEIYSKLEWSEMIDFLLMSKKMGQWGRLCDNQPHRHSATPAFSHTSIQLHRHSTAPTFNCTDIQLLHQHSSSKIFLSDKSITFVYIQALFFNSKENLYVERRKKAK